MHVTGNALDAASMYCRSDNVELEAVFSNVSRDEFVRVVAAMQPVTTVADRLGVGVGNVRFTMSNAKAINEFCKSNTVTDPKHIAVDTKKLLERVHVDENHVLNLKLEKNVNDDAKLALLFQPKRHVRYMKRYSLLGPGYRIDMSIVRSASTTAPKIADVPLGEFVEAYEIEVEHVGDKSGGPEAVLRAINAGVARVSAALRRDGNNSGRAEVHDADADRIMGEYLTLVQQRGAKMVGPKPVTLELTNLLEPDVGIISIKSRYLVTEKADGVRAMLYVANDGSSWVMIADAGVLRWTRLPTVDLTLKASLLDCELVSTPDRRELLLAFDVYWFQGKPVAQLPLKAQEKGDDDRIAYMERFASLFAYDGFRLKRYRDVDKACEILEDARAKILIDYAIDGLVYTPMDLPVGGDFPEDTPKLVNAWDRVFKWKPPDQNSIDFSVDVDRDRALAYLYVEYSPSEERINPVDLLDEKKLNEKKLKNRRKLFEPVPTARLEFSADKGEFVAADGGVIRSGSIVEFFYVDGEFKAMRLRNDKNHTANFYNTAMNVWRSIQQPVLEGHICGTLEMAYEKTELLEDKYSLRREKRDRLPSLKMLTFHNWAKSRLINLAVASSGAQKVKLFDIGCGKAGDLYRWQEAKVALVFGVDLSDDSITNGVDGACQRAMSRRTPDTRCIFARFDASKELTLEGIVDSPDADGALHDQQHAQVLRRVLGAPDALGIADGFDVVTCMFAIHYFFQDADRLDGFVKNVVRYLKPGGVFIGCTFDASKVTALLKAAAQKKTTTTTTSKRRAKAEGRASDGRVMWEVSESASTYAAGSPFGRDIAVYVDAINKKTPEYLVDFDLLQERLAEHGIVLADEEGGTGTFDSLYSIYVDDHAKTLAAVELTEPMKQFSFLNRWFMFRRGGAAPTAPG